MCEVGIININMGNKQFHLKEVMRAFVPLTQCFLYLGPFTKMVADPHNKSLTIVGLQEHQKYTFHLSALTNVGPGPPTTVTVKTQTIRESNSGWSTLGAGADWVILKCIK